MSSSEELVTLDVFSGSLAVSSKDQWFKLNFNAKGRLQKKTRKKYGLLPKGVGRQAKTDLEGGGT